MLTLSQDLTDAVRTRLGRRHFVPAALDEAAAMIAAAHPDASPDLVRLTVVTELGALTRESRSIRESAVRSDWGRPWGVG